MDPNGVIVTGGSYEEGLSVAEALAKGGYAVSIWDDDSSLLHSAHLELKDLGLEVDTRTVDVGNPNDIVSTYEAVRSRIGVPVALFNMATLKNSFLLGDPETRSADFVPFWAAPLDKLRRIVEVNAIGAMMCSAVIAGDMVARKTGSIVNFSTSAKTQRDQEHVPYGASKSFIESFSSAISSQLRPFDVRVNVISSGGMVSRRGKANPSLVASDWARELVLYLAGDTSKSVTAQLFRGASLTPIANL